VWLACGTGSNMSQVVVNGSVQAFFIRDKMDALVFEAVGSEYFISRNKLEELCAISTPGPTKSPRLTKNGGVKRGQAKAPPPAPPEPSFDMRKLPTSPIGELGVSAGTQTFLEVSRCIGRFYRIRLTPV
jgi:hypothetical protein